MKEMRQQNIEGFDFGPNGKITEEIEKWISNALQKGITGLLEEFEDLKRFAFDDAQPSTSSIQWEAGLNRYKDVPCQDKYRVILKWPKQKYDYIHANYVATPASKNRFICTQGPLDNTIVDFWHMVVQEGTDVLIMLCNCKEKGMDKCAQYWPLEEQESRIYGDVQITNKLVRSMTPDETSIRQTILSVKWTENGVERQREIRHYQWIDWPDRGVPPCKLTALTLLSHVRRTSSPIVVHCSAGIGRTGTIVAIEYILERLQSGKPCETMSEIVRELRNQRTFSIQMDLQYLFVHRLLLFYFFEHCGVGNSAGNQQLYQKFIEEYDRYIL